MNKIIVTNTSFLRLRPLDSLRGFAAVGVAFFFHYKHFNYTYFETHMDALPLYSIFQWFYYCGWNLVDFFFVLSGFIFMHVYSEKIADDTVDARSFFILRLSRLYPLHIITLFAVAFLQYYRFFSGKGFFQGELNDLYHFILNLLFIQSGLFEDGMSFNSPSWSLSTEIIAYIFFFYVLKKFKNPLPVFGFLIFLGLSILQKQLNIPFFNQTTARVLIGFFIGALTYILNLQIVKLERKKRNILFSLIIIFSILIGVMIFKAGFTRVFGAHWERLMPMLVYPLLIITVLNVFILNKFLSLKPFTYIGDLSYSIYLLHFPVQLLMVTFLPMMGLVLNYNSWTGMAFFMTATFFLAALSYHFVEVPLQNYIRRRYLVKSTV